MWHAKTMAVTLHRNNLGRCSTMAIEEAFTERSHRVRFVRSGLQVFGIESSRRCQSRGADEYMTED